SADGGKINLRLPLIEGVNACDRHIQDVIAFLKRENIRAYRVNLLKYHSTGSGKYGQLGRTYDESGMAEPDSGWLERAREA
ncbi:glycyl-radical enzyme activating protein, partial [Xanthomonas citri pv. citri]|nr:glycyl-radical enzyme activating protein [Xanthomonas citri pv. citri]